MTRSALWICFASILVVGLAGVAAAASARATTTTEKAPYTGVGLGVSESYNYLCEAGTKLLEFPSFNTTTGKAISGGNATANSCPYPPGSKPLSEQDLVMVAAFESGNITKHSGLTDFETHWKLSFKGNLHVHSGGAGQFAQAVGAVVVTGYLYNGSSGTSTSFTESIFDYAVNTSTGKDVSIKESKATVTEYLNTTLASTDTYSLVTLVEVVVESEVSLGGSSAAYSEIQMYGSGEGATLTSYSF